MMNQRRLCVHGEKCRPFSFKQLLNCRILHNEDQAITIEVVAEHCAIKLARLRKYIADSEPDQIPFLALLRIANFLKAWDLVDFALQQYHRRTASIESGAAPTNVLNEAVDVALRAAQLLEEVRRAADDGIDANERARILEHVRAGHRELEDIVVALGDQGGSK